MPGDADTARQRLLSGLPLSCAQIAVLAGCDNRTVANWLRSGKIEGTKTPGGHWLVAVSEVREKILGVPA